MLKKPPTTRCDFNSGGLHTCGEMEDLTKHCFLYWKTLLERPRPCKGGTIVFV